MLLAKIRGRAIAFILILGLTGSGLGIWQVCAQKAQLTSKDVVSRPTEEAPAVSVGGGKAAQPETTAPIAGPTSLIRGKVFDTAGHAAPRAAVTALIRRPFRPGEHGLRDEVVARGQADEEGMFRLCVPAQFPTWFPERQVILVAKAPGHAPLTNIVRLAEQGATEIDFRLTKAERVVRGRLLALDGAAAPGARLRVIRLGDVACETVQGVANRDGQNLDWPGPVVTDTEGRFALSGVDPEQGVWLQVEDDRYAPDAFRLRGVDQPTEIRLKPAQMLEGRIIAADTGKVVADVKLTTRLPAPYLILARVPVPDYLSVATRVVPPGSLDGVSGTDGRFQLQSPAGAATILDVHPPTDSPYLAVSKKVDWPEGVVLQRLAVTLPRGVVVRGRVVDQDDAPVPGASVQFGSPARSNPAFLPDVIQGCARIVLADKDGRFSLTVPAGPVRLAAHGPTHAYRPQPLRYWSVLEKDDEPERWGWREPLPAERRFYTHAEQELQLTPGENPAEVELRLVHGQAVAGRLVSPDGAPVRTAVLLCGEKVSPLMNGEMQPLPMRAGRYELPGCVRDRVYPVLFLDAVNGWGAAVDLRAGRDSGPEVRLARCGSARVALACHNYESTYQQFPPNTWLAYLLPFIEQSGVAQGLQSPDWSTWLNAMATKLPLLYCPSEPRPNSVGTASWGSYGDTWYVAVGGHDVVYDGSILQFNGQLDFNADPSRQGILTWIESVTFPPFTVTDIGGRISQVTDGLSNTVMTRLGSRGGKEPSPPGPFW